MLSDNHRKIFPSTGRLDELPHLSYEGILAFIARHLPTFAAEQRDHAEPIQNENGLTQRLVNLLKVRRDYEPFIFDKEHMETEAKGNSPRGDFAILTQRKVQMQGQPQPERKVIMVFEAKRLDRNLLHNREREYVVGYSQNGGIERFRSQVHGRAVARGGLIGYVQSDTFAHWEDKINGWIQDLSQQDSSSALPWRTREHLHLHRSDDMSVARFTSTHPRESGKIRLHHFWVNLA